MYRIASECAIILLSSLYLVRFWTHDRYIGKYGYVLISHIIWDPWVCTGLDVIENSLLTRVTKNPVRYFRFSFKKLLDLPFLCNTYFVSVTGKIYWPYQMSADLIAGPIEFVGKWKFLTIYESCMSVWALESYCSVLNTTIKCCETCRNHWPNEGEFLRWKITWCPIALYFHYYFRVYRWLISFGSNLIAVIFIPMFWFFIWTSSNCDIFGKTERLTKHSMKCNLQLLIADSMLKIFNFKFKWYIIWFLLSTSYHPDTLSIWACEWKLWKKQTCT